MNVEERDALEGWLMCEECRVNKGVNEDALEGG